MHIRRRGAPAGRRRHHPRAGHPGRPSCRIGALPHPPQYRDGRPGIRHSRRRRRRRRWLRPGRIGLDRRIRPLRRLLPASLRHLDGPRRGELVGARRVPGRDAVGGTSRHQPQRRTRRGPSPRTGCGPALRTLPGPHRRLHAFGAARSHRHDGADRLRPALDRAAPAGGAVADRRPTGRSCSWRHATVKR